MKDCAKLLSTFVFLVNSAKCQHLCQNICLIYFNGTIWQITCNEVWKRVGYLLKQSKVVFLINLHQKLIWTLKITNIKRSINTLSWVGAIEVHVIGYTLVSIRAYTFKEKGFLHIIADHLQVVHKTVILKKKFTQN